MKTSIYAATQSIPPGQFSIVSLAVLIVLTDSIVGTPYLPHAFCRFGPSSPPQVNKPTKNMDDGCYYHEPEPRARYPLFAGHKLWEDCNVPRSFANGAVFSGLINLLCRLDISTAPTWKPHQNHQAARATPPSFEQRYLGRKTKSSSTSSSKPKAEASSFETEGMP